MNSIAVTKPDMGVLSRERLQLSPFGILAQTFAEDLLARAEQKEGLWSYVPLELLEEGERVPPSEAVRPKVTLQVDLQLVLEALRREGDRSEQQQATERIVERVLQLQAKRGPAPAEKAAAPERPASPVVQGIVRQEFHQHLTQNIHITQSLSQGADLGQQRPPGDLARQAEAFSQRLQTLREEGMAFPRESTAEQGRVRVSKLPEGTSPLSPPHAPQEAALPPQEAMELLEDRGEESARTTERAQAALARSGERLQSLLEQVLTHKEKEASPGKHSAPPLERGPEKNVRPTVSGKPYREPTAGEHQPGGTEKPAGEERPAGRTRSEGKPSVLDKAAAGISPPLSTTARDIRMRPEGVLHERPEQSSENPGTTAAAQPPVELSHRTPAEGESPPYEGDVPRGRGTERGHPSAAPAEPAGQSGEKPSSRENRTGEQQKGRQDSRRQDAVQRTASGAEQKKHTAPGRNDQEARAEKVTGEDTQPHAPDHTEKAAEAAVPGTRTLSPTVRDIRTGGNPPKEQDGAKQPLLPGAEQMVRPPVELSHRMAAEGEETAPWAETALQSRKKEKPEQNRPASVSVKRKERGERDRGGEDERRQRAAAGETGTGQRHLSGTAAQSPYIGADLPGRAGDLQFAGKIPGPAEPGARTLPPTARDIRLGPGNHLGDQSEIQGSLEQLLSSQTEPMVQPPLELAHRLTEAGGDSPFKGDADGSRAKKPGQVFAAPGAENRQSGESSPGGKTESGQRARTGPGPEDRRYGAQGETIRRPVLGKARAGTSVKAGPKAPVRSTRPTAKAMAAAAANVGTLPVAARDIRVGGENSPGERNSAEGPQLSRQAEIFSQIPLELSRRAELAGGAGAESQPPADLLLNRPGSAGEIGFSGGQMAQAPMAGESTRPAGAAPFQPEPLTYGPGQPADARQSQGAAPRQSGGAVDLQNLPDWAKRFLREGAPTGPSGRTMGVARDIASLPPPETGDSVHWTAPSYQPPEAPMAYREREQAPRRQEPSQVHISDVEIQRTADQVYRLIEERLRRERRRLGF